MGLDTDDIVALAMDIPLIVIAVLLIVAMFFMKSPYVVKELRRILIKAQTNSELRHYSILRIILGDKEYNDLYLECQNSAIQNYESSRENIDIPYQKRFYLDRDLFESLQEKPFNERTQQPYSYEDWERIKWIEMIRNYNTVFIPPSHLYFAISRKIESKEL